MWLQIISFFAKRHLLTNFIFAGVFIGGIFAWQNTSKEEMPDVTFDFVRISVRYPGAPPEDVEYFIAQPIEEKVRGLDGVYRVNSNCSVGSANITVELEQNYPKVDEAVTEIRSAVLDVRYPDDVIDDPSVRVFKTSKKAILDIAIYRKDVHLLDVPTRREVQKIAFALENQLLALPQVHSVDRRSYLQEEIQIKAHPQKLLRYNIPFNAVTSEVRSNHVRQPAGTIESEGEPKVTLLSELNTVDRLKDLIVQGGFEGRAVRLKEVAEIEEGFEKNTDILKINGHEAVMFSVVKNSSYGILESLDAVTAAVERFRKNNLKESPVEIALLDDESIDVRNRLNLIGTNGALGFVLILISLLLFLNKRSGFWVAMGIPFTICFTMIASKFLGYTINGTTLAAVIIVMGMIVDDAIVVAENINRERAKGLSEEEATIRGTAYMMMPVTASILTTCVAFVPLFFFSGHFGKFVSFIPPIIFLMLGSSLLESILILPGHMNLHLPFMKKFSSNGNGARHWFEKHEEAYGRFLEERILPRKWQVLGLLAGILILSGFIIKTKMKFVMFPDEETRDITLSGQTAPGSTRFETAEKTIEVEKLILPYLGKEAVGFQTDIARSRRGGGVQENQFRISIEIVPKEKRKKSANQIIAEIEGEMGKLKGFHKLEFRKSRWGQSSGSPIELIVQQNNEKERAAVVQELVQRMQAHPALDKVEIDEVLMVDEYKISINREKIKRLSINSSDVASTFRSALEGSVLFEFPNGDEETRVRLTTVDEAKENIEKVLDIPVENRRNYLVPLRDIVTLDKVRSPNTIARRDMKRTSIIDADMRKGSKMTPLEAAEDLENHVFPEILAKYPTTRLSFGGEVQDTRESKADFRNAVILTVFLIYMILALLFNSAFKPLVIMLAIPFGVAGVVLTFALHGKFLFGFFAAVGALGLAGVVINDSIIMLVKLDDDFDPKTQPETRNRQIAQIAQTRLRAVILTTVTTVAGVLPTAYGVAGYDAMLAEMMLALAWGLVFGTFITLFMVPCLYAIGKDFRFSKAWPALLLLLAHPLQASTRTLTMEEFVEQAAQKDTEFEAILTDALALKYAHALALPASDIVLTVKQEQIYYRKPNEDDPATSVNLSKLFPLTGTEIAAGYGASGRRNSDRTDSNLSATLSQPIAQNAFGRDTRLLKKITGLEVDVARYQIVEAYEDYMASLMTLFLDWYEAYENLNIAQGSYNANLQLLEDMKKREKSKIALPIDVNKSSVQVLAKKERLLEAEERYKSRLALVRRSLRHEGEEELIPAASDDSKRENGDFKARFEKFWSASRTYQTLKLLEDKSRLQVSREADGLLPSLNLLLTYESEGEGTGLKNAENLYVAGLSLSYPFGNQKAGAEKKTAKIRERQAQLETENVFQKIRTQLENLHRQIERENKLIDLADEKVKLARSILTDETENYSLAKVTLNDYITAVNNVDTNRFNRISRSVLWQKLRIEWLRLTDRLVSENILKE